MYKVKGEFPKQSQSFNHEPTDFNHSCIHKKHKYILVI